MTCKKCGQRFTSDAVASQHVAADFGCIAAAEVPTIELAMDGKRYKWASSFNDEVYRSWKSVRHNFDAHQIASFAAWERELVSA